MHSSRPPSPSDPGTGEGFDPTSSPYAWFCLDPLSSIEELTEVLGELAEDADPDARAALQAAWRQLTLNAQSRLDAALFAHPRPARNLPRNLAELDSGELVRRFRFSVEVQQTPSDFTSRAAALRELVVLPPVRLVDGGSGGEWSDLPASDDPLLRL